MEWKIHVQSPCLIFFCLCPFEARKFSFVAKICARQCYEAGSQYMYFLLRDSISHFSRAINKTRGWDIPTKPNSWNKVPCGQFIKKNSVWYPNVNKRYSRLKNRARHKKSTQEKKFLIILNSRVEPQRKVVLRWLFFYKYIISQCIWEKKIKNLAPVV